MSEKIPRYNSRVIAQRPLTEGLFELTFERPDFAFRAGDEIQIHGPDSSADRPYSLLNGEGDTHLQILYRLIPDGLLTPLLSQLQAGDRLSFSGPFGNFRLKHLDRPVIFVATGTGIAPAVSFARTHPDLEIHLLHGVRRQQDLCYAEWFAPGRYYPCVSREMVPGLFHGRVTERFPTLSIPDDADFFLCGANDMIVAMAALLKEMGIADARISGEAYYWWR